MVCVDYAEEQNLDDQEAHKEGRRIEYNSQLYCFIKLRLMNIVSSYKSPACEFKHTNK